jgi:DNA invertase Pin-like site-specific DNA recombinase
MTNRTSVGISYVRFSHPDQAKGDSLRRQTEATAAWCQRNGVTLDTSLTLRDLGVSAFKGRHRSDDKHHLAQFLKLVERGGVPLGSYLIIENLDRLSREDVVPAVNLFTGILLKGVRIVQLRPHELVYNEKADMGAIMLAIVELSRGHSESQMKSERVGAAWANKRMKAREGTLLTRKVPAWLTVEEDRIALVPERVAIVKRIFSMATQGLGHALIVKRLIAEKVAPFGASGEWSRSYVALILKDRRVLGEFQPKKADGTPDGKPIPDYFPAVVTPNEVYAACASQSGRRHKPGRIGTHINPFAGLLRDARDGGTYYAATRTDRSVHTRVLINTKANEGRATCYSFPFIPFERAIFAMLSEIKPEDVLGPEDAITDTRVIEQRIEELEEQLGRFRENMMAGDSSRTLDQVVKAKETERDSLLAQLEGHREQNVSSPEDTWSQTQSLLEALGQADDPTEVRLRLRSLLPRVIASMWLYVSAQGRQRHVSVQIHFKESETTRMYSIFLQPPRDNGRGRTPGAWLVLSGTGDVLLHDLRRLATEDSVRTWHEEQAKVRIAQGQAILAKERRVRELAAQLKEKGIGVEVPPLREDEDHCHLEILP